MPATKDQIAERFFQHVVHYGLAKTSVEEVAHELGISKRTVYQHFGSKDEIFRYVVETSANDTVERVGREFAAIPSRWARLEKLMRELVLQATRDWLTRFEQTELRHQFEFGVRANRRAYDALIRSWTAEGAEAGEFHLIAGDAALTSRFIGALLQDAVEQIREDPAASVDDAAVEAVHKLLR